MNLSLKTHAPTPPPRTRPPGVIWAGNTASKLIKGFYIGTKAWRLNLRWHRAVVRTELRAGALQTSLWQARRPASSPWPLGPSLQRQSTHWPIPRRHSLIQTLTPISAATPGGTIVAAGAAVAATTSRHWPVVSTLSTAATCREEQRTGEALGASSSPLPTTCSTIRPTAFEARSPVFSGFGGRWHGH
jgi:hypothetical protein